MSLALNGWESFFRAYADIDITIIHYQYHSNTAIWALPSVQRLGIHQDAIGMCWFGTFTGTEYLAQMAAPHQVTPLSHLLDVFAELLAHRQARPQGITNPYRNRLAPGL